MSEHSKRATESDGVVQEVAAMPVQFGSAASADFEAGTWTFEMQGGYRIAAGPFAILPRESYEELVAALKDSCEWQEVAPLGSRSLGVRLRTLITKVTATEFASVCASAPPSCPHRLRRARWNTASIPTPLQVKQE